MPAKNNDSEPLALFTVICRYRDGTYVEQLRAKGLPEAIEGWIQRALRSSTVPVPINEIPIIADQLTSEGPIAIQDCVSAWVATAFPESGPVWLDIIKTALE